MADNPETPAVPQPLTPPATTTENESNPASPPQEPALTMLEVSRFSQFTTWVNSLEREEAEDFKKQHEQDYGIELQKDHQQVNELVACHKHAEIQLQKISQVAIKKSREPRSVQTQVEEQYKREAYPLHHYLAALSQQIETKKAIQKHKDFKHQTVLQVFLQKLIEARPTSNSRHHSESHPPEMSLVQN